MASGSREPRVIAAIDFGTARSGYAYSFYGHGEVQYAYGWPGQISPYVKTPTQLLYDPEGKVESWGYDVRKRLAELRAKGEAKKYAFISNFKMQLHRDRVYVGSDGPYYSLDGKTPYTTPQGRRFRLRDVIADFLRILSQRCLEEIRNASANVLSDSDVRWCLTVPAIWTDADKGLMREAARQAGMIGSGLDEDERLVLTLEPEAATLYCEEDERTAARGVSAIAPGGVIMIVDCGGGTVDITTHRVRKNRVLEELVTGTGGPHGSTYVDRSFELYLAKRISVPALRDFHESHPVEYVTMMANWERAKCNYAQEPVTYVDLEARLMHILSTRYRHVFDELEERQGSDISALHIPRAEMDHLFAEALDGIVALTREQLRKLNGQPCDALYLVGGFSLSPVLRRRMDDEFGRSVKTIVKPPLPERAVLGGAVLFGLDPSRFVRRSRLTYGCSTNSPFIEGKHRPDKKFFSEDHQTNYCKDLFSTFVLVGQQVDIDDSRSFTFRPMKKNQTACTFPIFSTEATNPMYIDEKGMTEIGSVTVQMPDTTAGLERQIQVNVYFGRTELKVEAIDLTTGNRSDVQVLFSTSKYS